MKQILLSIFLTLTALTVNAQDVFNPTLPGEPNALYKITIGVSHSAAGTVSGGGSYAEGTKVTIRRNDTGFNSNATVYYKFKCWMLNGEEYTEAGTSSSFTYTVGTANANINAVYEVQNPDEVSSKLFLVSEPSDACTFNRNSGTRYLENNSVYLYYNTTSSTFKFQGWYNGNELVSKSNYFYYTIGEDDVTLTARFSYEPAMPGEPSGDQENVDCEDEEKTANEFRTAHITILSKTIDDVAISDLTSIEAALNDYDELSDGAKALLKDEKNHLDSLKTKVEELMAEEPDVPSDIEPSTDVSALTDALYFNDVENRAGDFNLDLNLKCAEENITAFQCDVYLPEGVEWKYTVDKRGKIIYDLPAFNEDRTDASYHTIAPIEQKSDGSYSIIVYSGEEEYIMDLDGAIMTLPLTVSEEMEAGDYNIIMKNIVIVPTEGSKISIDRMVSRLTIPSYMIGDANGDDAIDVADIVATIAYMRNHPSENFIFAAADVNEDNAIDVADIVGIIRIMRSAPVTSAAKSNSARLAPAVDAEAGSNLRITPFAVEQGTKEKTVTLDMNNPGEEFTAFQCDVYFPEGIEWKTTVDRRGNKKVVAPTFNVEADRTNALYHTIDAGYNADGSMSVIVYSSDMEIILDEKGAVLDLPFVFDENLAAGVYDIKLKNVKLSRVDATKAEPADYTFSVVVGSPSGDIALKGDYTGTNDALKLLVDGSSANVTCENLLLDDEDGYTVSNTFTAENVSYSRPMANEWGTVCLPYAVQSDDNVAYYNIIDVQNGTLTIQKYETLPANTPALMQKVNGDAAVCEAHDVMVGGAMNNVTGEVTMHGSYANNIMVTDANAYYIKNNKFWLNNQYFYIDAFRAYFTLESSAAKSGCLSIGDTTTAIDTLINGEKVAGVWSTNGVMRNNVEKGMNIIKMADGKCVKVLVK